MHQKTLDLKGEEVMPIWIVVRPGIASGTEVLLPEWVTNSLCEAVKLAKEHKDEGWHVMLLSVDTWRVEAE